MKVPLFVVGSLTIGALVAVSCVLSFDITRRNAESSIDTVSRQLSETNIKAARRAVKRDLLEEPQKYLNGLKEGYSRQLYGPFESGMYNGSTATAKAFFQDGTTYLKANTSFATFVALIQADGEGCVVRLGETYGQLSTLGMQIFQGVQMGPIYSLMKLPMPPIPLDFRTRQYYTVVEPEAHGGWAWTSITPTTDSEYTGLIMSLSTAVYHPYSGMFNGVVTAAVGFQWIDLRPYRSHPSIDMLMIDADRYLVASTSADTVSDSSLRVALNESVNSTALYRACGEALPPLEAVDAEGKYFRKFGHAGKTWWLEVLPVASHNLQLYLISLTPEEIYFDEIYEGNRRTTAVVVLLVAGSVMVAVALILLAMLPLHRLGRAFDSVSQMRLDTHDVERIPKGSALLELNSLQLGFWEAVGTVRQVQAFIPVLGDSDDSGTEVEDSVQTGTRHDSQTVTSQTMSRVSTECKSDGNKAGVADQLAIGLRKSAHATVLCMKAAGFEKQCKRSEGLGEAVVQHGQLFGRVHDLMKRHNGYLLGVRGDKVQIGWGLGRGAPSGSRASAARLAMQIVGLPEPQGLFPLHVGLHHCAAVYGILGRVTQRFQVFGSELDEVSQRLAGEGVACGLAVLGSAAVVRDAALLVHHKVDVLEVGGVEASVEVHWVRSIANVKEEEWMYQLEEAQREHRVFLEPFFEALGTKNFDGARRELSAFEAKHGEHKSLAARHWCRLGQAASN